MSIILNRTPSEQVLQDFSEFVQSLLFTDRDHSHLAVQVRTAGVRKFH